jgi:glycosyltransferase involved in cell wall biosynthesis
MYQIVFFSRHPNPLPVVFDAVDAGIAKLLVRPPRKDLMALFSQASIFVFPSWIEGFGLPLLEAMACGAPVIASDRGSIPEVAGEAAIIIDAEDDISLADNISTLLTSPDKAAELRFRGFERASKFKWERTAQDVLNHYRQLFKSPATK